MLDGAFKHGARERVLLGFDFPIGLPAAYGKQTNLPNFKDALPFFGTGPWEHFFDVASRPDEISMWRPFYPQTPFKGVTPASLVEGLKVNKFDDLLRVCEQPIKNRPSPCCLFWTLGPNQVGKGAISGWQEVVRPAIKQGARLWPFDGTLAEHARTTGVVIAETYPAEAYHMVGAAFGRREAKRRLEVRISKAKPILDWACRHGVELSEEAGDAVLNGFGSEPSSGKDDAFDAFLGLLGMIEVVDERRVEAPAHHATTAWEGWILGR